MLVQLFSACVPFSVAIFSIVHFWNGNMEDQQVVCVESRINALQLDKVLYQQRAQNEQNQRERELADDKNLSKPPFAWARREASAVAFQRIVRPIFGGAQQRHKTKKQTRQQRERAHKSQRSEIEEAAI